MSEEPLNVRAIASLVWRSRLLVSVIVVLGLCGGIAYGAKRPPQPSAVALVLLPPSAVTGSGSPVRSMHTQVILAESSPVLSTAGKAVSPHVTPQQLKPDVAVRPLSQDVLQIEVRAATSGDAVRLANAVATSYIRYVTAASTSSIAVLQKQSNRLEQQIRGIQGQIATISSKIAAEGALSPSGRQDSAQLASLQNEQQQLSLQLNSVDGQIVNLQLSSGTEAASTRILQRAVSATSPSLVARALKLGLIGAAAGLLVGVVLVLFRSRGDDRLRFRNQLSSAIGVPVLASVETKPCRSAREWNELLAHPGFSPIAAWNLRRLLHHLAPGDAGTGMQVRIISFSDDPPAFTLGPLVAVYSATLGIATGYLPPSHEDSLLELRAACTTEHEADRPEQLSMLVTESGRLDGEKAQVVVSTAIVKRSEPQLSFFGGANVLSVSAGFATRGDLARLALAVADTGSSLDGIVVVNPEPHDSTTGSTSSDASHPPATAWASRPVAAGSSPGDWHG